MTESISFIHAADLHLDSPFKGLSHLPEKVFDEVRQSTFQSFHHLIEIAISKQVDFIVLVGDLFDHERQSLKAQIRLRNAFQELEKHQIQVYLSYGNHDFLNGNKHAVAFPENVHIFPNEEITSFSFQKNTELSVQISGFSYENRAVIEEKVIQYPLRDRASTFHIGMLHGSVDGNKQHDTYAPFRIQQLLEKDYDYWALGHIHKRQELHENPPIIYPGNIQSRHRNEPGAKGCYLVELKRNATQTTFLPLHRIEFLHLDIHLTSDQKMEEVENLVWDKLKDKQKGKYLVSINWHSTSDYWVTEHANGWMDDLIDSLNEQMYADDAWIYIYKNEMKLKKHDVPEYNAQFMSEIDRAFSEMDLTEELNDLTRHAKGRKFFERPEDEWKEAAKQLLYVELLKTERDE